MFSKLHTIEEGSHGGEVRLIDALIANKDALDIYGYIFEGTFYDIGRKLDYLRATVEIASERDDLRAEFLDFLADFVIRKKLV